MSKQLFTPFQLGGLSLSNRVAMAPMTRNRADFQTDCPNELIATHYAQRASAGLLITEGTQTSPESKGYLATPGIYSEDQIKGWTKVAEEVHNNGGKIFIQFMHAGRISHTSIQPNGISPISASDVIANGNAFGFDADGKPGFVPCSQPRAIKLEEIPALIEEFKQSAINARKAGLDGIELHSANGYLLEQFLNSKVNVRTDAYGGSVENRARLIIEIAKACADAIGPDRVGIRFSPNGRYNDMPESDNYVELYLYLAKELNKIGIGYIHIFDQTAFGSPAYSDDLLKQIREVYKGAIIICGGYDAERANAILESGQADLVAFGRPFIANPDLVSRLENNYPLAEADQSVWFGGDGKGYTDFPAYKA